MIAVAGLLLPACDDLKLLPRADWAEAKYRLYDGAFRVGTTSAQTDRELDIRCFGHTSTAEEDRQLDLRYTIVTPIRLSKVGNAFTPATAVSLNVSIDDGPATGLNARPIFGADVSFLADIDRQLAEQLASAKKKIVVVPTKERERLDDIIEFGTRDLSQHLARVLEACKAAKPRDKSPPPAKTKG